MRAFMETITPADGFLMQIHSHLAGKKRSCQKRSRRRARALARAEFDTCENGEVNVVCEQCLMLTV